MVWSVAVVEATFQLAGKQRETASELLEAVGIPRSLRPVSMNGQLVIRREIHLKQATPPPSPSQDSSSNSSDSGSGMHTLVHQFSKQPVLNMV